MRGFSLIEVVVASSIIVFLGTMSVPAYKVFQEKNNLESAKTTIVGALRRTQVLAQANKGDDYWGLHIKTGQATIFKGASYAGRDAGSDENFSLPGRVVPGGLSDIVFNKLTGFPQTAGTITLTHSNETKRVVINEYGVVSF